MTRLFVTLAVGLFFAIFMQVLITSTLDLSYDLENREELISEVDPQIADFGNQIDASSNITLQSELTI